MKCKTHHILKYKREDYQAKKKQKKKTSPAPDKVPSKSSVLIEFLETNRK